MNIYQIDAEILNCLDLETGEILDPERLEHLQMQRDIKIENVILWIKNLNAEIDAFKAEEGSLAKRRKSRERKRDSLMKYVDAALEGCEFETARARAKYNKGEAVKILDEKLIPKEYWRQNEPEINRAEIKKAIKAGKTVDGAEITATYSLQVI